MEVGEMNGHDGGGAGAVDAVLGDRLVRIRVVDGVGGMGSVGLGKLNLRDALETIGEAAGLVYERLEHLTPTKASVEFGVSFSVQGGTLTALLFDGKADASLTIRLEWDRAQAPVAVAGGG
jgi:hypothetical protein